jgi:hypothetical protein
VLQKAIYLSSVNDQNPKTHQALLENKIVRIMAGCQDMIHYRFRDNGHQDNSLQIGPEVTRKDLTICKIQISNDLLDERSRQIYDDLTNGL